MRAAGGIAALVAGCASSPAPRPAVIAPVGGEGEDALRIVEPTFGAAHSVRREEVLVPFGVNQNGTELVYVLLDAAARKGAAYVGDLAMIVTFRWRGTPIECRQQVVFEGDPRLAPRGERDGGVRVPAAAAPAYGTEIGTFEPQLVSFVADDKELDCRQVAGQVWRRRQRDGNLRVAEGARLGDVAADDTEREAEIALREECHWRQVQRDAQRWDYEVKLGFVPPNWTHLARRFADGATLRTTRPACYALAEEELAKQPLYRLTAVAYHSGHVKKRLPDELPSRGAVEGQKLRQTNETEQQCMDRLKHAGTRKLIDEFDVVEQCLTQPDRRRFPSHMGE